MSLDIGMLCLSFFAGLFVGIFFYMGLWWTILKFSSKHVMIWWWTSFLVRITIALLVFYLIAQEHLERYLLILIGFIISRKIVLNMKTRDKRESS